jgi:hypothetical protein
MACPVPTACLPMVPLAKPYALPQVLVRAKRTHPQSCKMPETRTRTGPVDPSMRVSGKERKERKTYARLQACVKGALSQ